MPKGRSDNQRTKLMRLKEYLLENTDENNSVKTADIIEYMDGLNVSVK